MEHPNERQSEHRRSEWVLASRRPSSQATDDRTKLAIKAIVEVTKAAEQASKQNVEASKQGIEEATTHPGAQARNGGRSNAAFERSK